MEEILIATAIALLVILAYLMMSAAFLWRGNGHGKNISSECSIKEPTMEAPAEPERLVPGPVLAVRGWRFRKTEWSWSGNVPLLLGVGVDKPWSPGSADRASGASPAPNRGGMAGYWGLRFKEDIPQEASVGGIVALWGRIIEHERGWRAEYAYPVVIWPNVNRNSMPGFPRPRTKNQLDEVVPELAALYGIPCLDAPPWCGGELVSGGAAQ